MDVCESELASLVGISQTLMIQSHQSENCRLQIVNVHRILHDLKTKLIGLSNRDTWFHASAGEPNRECLRVMITSETPFQCRARLDHRRTAEFPTPYDQCFIE